MLTVRTEPHEDEPLRPGTFGPDEFEAGRTPAMPAASNWISVPTLGRGFCEAPSVPGPRASSRFPDEAVREEMRNLVFRAQMRVRPRVQALSHDRSIVARWQAVVATRRV